MTTSTNASEDLLQFLSTTDTAKIYKDSIKMGSIGATVINELVGHNTRCFNANDIISGYTNLVKSVYPIIVNAFINDCEHADVIEVKSQLKIEFSVAENKFKHHINPMVYNAKHGIKHGGVCQTSGNSSVSLSMIYDTVNQFVAYMNEFYTTGDIDIIKYRYNDYSNTNMNVQVPHARGPLGILSTVELVSYVFSKACNLVEYTAPVPEIINGVTTVDTQAEFNTRNERVSAIFGWLAVNGCPLVAPSRFISEFYLKSYTSTNQFHKNPAECGKYKDYLYNYIIGLNASTATYDTPFLFSTLKSKHGLRLETMFNSKFFKNTSVKSIYNKMTNFVTTMSYENTNCIALAMISDLIVFTNAAALYACKPVDIIGGTATLCGAYVFSGVRVNDFINHGKSADGKYTKFDAKFRLKSMSYEEAVASNGGIKLTPFDYTIPSAIIGKYDDASNVKTVKEYMYTDNVLFSKLTNRGNAYDTILSFDVNYGASKLNINATAHAYIIKSYNGTTTKISTDIDSINLLNSIAISSVNFDDIIVETEVLSEQQQEEEESTLSATE